MGCRKRVGAAEGCLPAVGCPKRVGGLALSFSLPLYLPLSLSLPLAPSRSRSLSQRSESSRERPHSYFDSWPPREGVPHGARPSLRVIRKRESPLLVRAASDSNLMAHHLTTRTHLKLTRWVLSWHGIGRYGWRQIFKPPPPICLPHKITNCPECFAGLLVPPTPSPLSPFTLPLTFSPSKRLQRVTFPHAINAARLARRAASNPPAPSVSLPQATRAGLPHSAMLPPVLSPPWHPRWPLARVTCPPRARGRRRTLLPRGPHRRSLLCSRPLRRGARQGARGARQGGATGGGERHADLG